MPLTRFKWVMDRDAYRERRAIMEIEGTDGLTASREASECAYATRLGRVCTAEANGDPQPARVWRAEITERFGPELALAVMDAVKENLEAELNWRR